VRAGQASGLDRFQLIGHPHRAHAALADALQQLVPAGDDGAGGYLIAFAVC
jgi:hypothetical protein